MKKNIGQPWIRRVKISFIRFQTVLPQLIDPNSCQVEVGPVHPTSPEIKKPEFGLDQTPILQILISKTEID